MQLESIQHHLSPAQLAALQAQASLPAPQPTQAVDYISTGRTFIIGPADIALDWAERLKDRLEITVLVTEARGNEELPAQGEYRVHAGSDVSVSGWLGHFSVHWQDQPVPAAGLIGALSFTGGSPQAADCDMVFDLSREALIRLPHPPQGYVAAGRDVLEQFDAVLKLTGLIGEFEKPRYFDYKADACAHSRNRIQGCHHCIDVCSTGAIQSAGNGIRVEPHLCMGCGACASGCPTGAIRHVFPSVPDLGTRMKAQLTAWRAAGGESVNLMFVDAQGEDWLLRRAHREGWPPSLLPVRVHDVASIGPELMLAALCYGAAQVSVLVVNELTDAYAANLQRQIALVRTLLSGMGYEPACTLLDTGFALSADVVSIKPASFNLFADKRRSLDFCISHLQSEAPQQVEEIALPAGAPYGTISINSERCTLCMSCVSACPAKALQDNPELPQLSFIETNCVQCGLCVDTCPEKALSKSARLLLTPAAKQPRVLNEAQPFHCVRCGSAFGTRSMVENMMKRLSGHSLFADPAAQRRLQMCGDCRVIDMMEAQSQPASHVEGMQ